MNDDDDVNNWVDKQQQGQEQQQPTNMGIEKQ